jgi:hypothetical protein
MIGKPQSREHKGPSEWSQSPDEGNGPTDGGTQTVRAAERRPSGCPGLPPATLTDPAKSVAAYGIGLTLRHVTPGGLLRSYRAVTVGERECNQRPAARDRINTGVYVFTRVNASGMRQLKEKWAVCGSRTVTCGYRAST